MREETERRETIAELMRRYAEQDSIAQFIPHYRSPRSATFRLTCKCGLEWSTPVLDRETLPEMLDWINQHCRHDMVVR